MNIATAASLTAQESTTTSGTHATTGRKGLIQRHEFEVGVAVGVGVSAGEGVGVAVGVAAEVAGAAELIKPCQDSSTPPPTPTGAGGHLSVPTMGGEGGSGPRPGTYINLRTSQLTLQEIKVNLLG